MNRLKCYSSCEVLVNGLPNIHGSLDLIERACSRASCKTMTNKALASAHEFQQ